MNSKTNWPRIIVLSGPESVGKTTLAQALAKHYGGEVVTEFARTYVENLNSDYSYEDVEVIAQRQIEEYKQALLSSARYIFFDTSLVITKVWFLHVFNRIPDWFEKEYARFSVDLVLLLKPDLPWIEDGVRENGGANRLELYNIYKEEFNKLPIPFVTIGGVGEARMENAIEKINSFY